MNNEIGRKITSLTLMTIMVAGGMTFAIPGVMPAAHAANANLFVSAENSQFDNYMAGAMVIEVVVIDSDISDTNEGKGEPDVTVQGKSLRMAQATDGNWYGYFANLQSANAADATQPATPVSSSTVGLGLDFGQGCDNLSASTVAVYEDVTATPIETSIAVTEDINSITGLNAVTIAALAASGYNLGGHYHVVIEAGTVDSVSVVGEVVGNFTIGASAAHLVDQWRELAGKAPGADVCESRVRVLQPKDRTT